MYLSALNERAAEARHQRYPASLLKMSKSFLCLLFICSLALAATQLSDEYAEFNL